MNTLPNMVWSAEYNDVIIYLPFARPARISRGSIYTYYLSAGTVQPYIRRNTPFYMKHFARAEYDSQKPVISKSIREQVTPLLDKLNQGMITIEEFEKKLDRIYY